ncbi:MAG: tetratricopeptide repeat protein [Acidobacteria bacterium]|nr:tetratricopeptide repeat protein [Acidobacteriota bacterium]
MLNRIARRTDGRTWFISRARACASECSVGTAIAGTFLSLVFLGPLLPLFAEQGSEKLLEFRGQVTLPPGTVSRGRHVRVALSGVSAPFASQSWLDSKGRFRFRDLPPATYTVAIYIPGAGEIIQTVEITESFADSNHRVEKKFLFDSETLQQRARAVPRGLVSVRQLSIPDKARREYMKSMDRLKQLDVEGAIQHLQKAIEVAPQYSEAYNNLGTIYFQRKEYLTAEKYFCRALELEPGAFEPLVNLGGVLLALKRPEEALEVNRQAQQSHPQDALANAQLGLNYFFLRDYEQAVTYLQRTQELDPAHFSQPQLSLAEIYLRRSEEEAALRELQDFLKYHPDSPEAENVRATIEEIQRSQKIPPPDEQLPL